MVVENMRLHDNEEDEGSFDAIKDSVNVNLFVNFLIIWGATLFIIKLFNEKGVKVVFSIVSM